jgi:hypothetical protein
MRDVFLSYHYDEPNTRIARQIEDLLESHSLRATTGDVLGGGVLTEEIKRQIEAADALIAVSTRNKEVAGGGWTTYEYVKNELQHARGVGKPAIALVEQGVDVTGLYKENEYIPFTSADSLPAFLKLSRTIWSWKNRVGRLVKLQLLPEAVATEIWKNKSSGIQWQYRLSSGIRDTGWLQAYPRKEPYGLFLFVQVPDDTMSIEVRVAVGGKAWVSDATQFLLPLPLVPE